MDKDGRVLGDEIASTVPAGNQIHSGAAPALRDLLIDRLGDNYFTAKRRNESAKSAVFTRKVGDTQPGGRPILFDRFYGAQLGGQAVDMLLAGHINGVSILMWNRERGFHMDGCDANDFRDRWGLIHARKHPSFYDNKNLGLSQTGIDYLLPIFTNADDMEDMHRTLFATGNLTQRFHSVNVDVNKRICYLEGTTDDGVASPSRGDRKLEPLEAYATLLARLLVSVPIESKFGKLLADQLQVPDPDAPMIIMHSESDQPIAVRRETRRR